MIWVVGSKGMLGKEVCDLLEIKGMEYIGTDLDVDITASIAIYSIPFFSKRSQSSLPSIP